MPIEINVEPSDQVTVVELIGELDGNTAPGTQAQVLGLVTPGHGILLDMSRLEYMSSAGLRMLLSTYRSITANQAKVAIVGLSEDLRDTMSATGFLDFFATYESRAEGLAALEAS